MKTKVLFLMALLCLAVGKVSAYDWTGNTVNTTDEFYLYNVGFKAFLNSDGKFVDNPKNSSKWKFSSTSNGTISSGSNYIYVYCTNLGGNTASVRDESAEVSIKESGNTSGAYKFYYTYSSIFGSTTRYFSVQKSDAKITAAATDDEDNDWLLITQEQVDDYNAQSESWVSDELPSGDGEYYLYNVAYAEYMYADLQKSWASLTDISNATKFTIAKTSKGYTISSGGSYYYLNGSDGKFQNKSTDWTFENKGAGYQIYASSRYIQGHGTSVYCKKTSEKDFDIRETYWILISADQYKEDMNLAITIPSNGYTTYSNNSSAVDFSNSGLTVYYASSVTSDLITFTKIENNVIPKGQGVLIKGDAGEHNVTVSTSTSTLSSNSLKAGDGKAHSGCYALAAKSDGSDLGFYKLNANVTIPYGKAYLDTNGTTLSVKSFAINDSNFDDEVTAVCTVSADESDAPAYSVTGVKVGKNYKGIVIKNGKTYLQK